jgi:hypothetical protein
MNLYETFVWLASHWTKYMEPVAFKSVKMRSFKGPAEIKLTLSLHFRGLCITDTDFRLDSLCDLRDWNCERIDSRTPSCLLISLALKMINRMYVKLLDVRGWHIFLTYFRFLVALVISSHFINNLYCLISWENWVSILSIKIIHFLTYHYL